MADTVKVDLHLDIGECVVEVELSREDHAAIIEKLDQLETVQLRELPESVLEALARSDLREPLKDAFVEDVVGKP